MPRRILFEPILSLIVAFAIGFLIAGAFPG